MKYSIICVEYNFKFEEYVNASNNFVILHAWILPGHCSIYKLSLKYGNPSIILFYHNLFRSYIFHFIFYTNVQFNIWFISTDMYIISIVDDHFEYWVSNWEKFVDDVIKVKSKCTHYLIKISNNRKKKGKRNCNLNL